MVKALRVNINGLRVGQLLYGSGKWSFMYDTTGLYSRYRRSH